MTKSSLLLLAGLATLAVAAPAPAPEAPEAAEPVKVPLTRRGRGHYTPNEDGSVNIERLLRTVEYTMAKYGVEASRGMKRAVANLPLTDQVSQGTDVEYYGASVVGGQTFSTDFDTGSADYFVPGPKCGKAQGCVGTTKYDQGGQNEGNTTSVTYGSGMISGENYFDTVCVAGLCAQHTNVISLTTAQGFSSAESEGLMGMAFSTIANSKQPTFFERLIAQGTVTAKQFSFYLGRSKSNTQGKSELTLGGKDSSRYTGALTSHPVARKGYWQIDLANVVVKNKNVANTAGNAAIDTGTTALISPVKAANAIYRALGGFPLPLLSGSATETIYVYPCKATPPSIRFGNQVYSINALDFNLGSSGLPGLCVGAIIGANLGDNLYVVGDTFLKSWYSVYDYTGSASVSFAKAV